VTTVISIGRSHLIHEEDPMISHEPANPPAADRPPGNAEERGQTGAQGLDGQSGMPFDYIDEALEETMIASAPPALTPETAIGPPAREAGQARLD